MSAGLGLSSQFQFQIQPSIGPISSIFVTLRKIAREKVCLPEWLKLTQTKVAGNTQTSQKSEKDSLPVVGSIFDEYEIDAITWSYRPRSSSLRESHKSANTFNENKYGVQFDPITRRQINQITSHILGSIHSRPSHNLSVPMYEQRRGFRSKRSDKETTVTSTPLGRIDVIKVPADSINKDKSMIPDSMFMDTIGSRDSETSMNSVIKDMPAQTRNDMKTAFYDGYHSSWRKNAENMVTSDYNRILAFSEGYRLKKRNIKETKGSRPVGGIMMVIFGFILIAAGLFISGKVKSGSIQIGSTLHEVNPELINVTFDDVKGVDEAKEELADLVDFLKNPKRFNALGAKLPKGCLLVGPPGVGKTLIARAVAGEAGVPFYQVSGAEFDEVFVGTGARKVRNLFNAAKENSPCVIFIDEIDSVGGKRTTSSHHPYANQTINQLLTEMDGFNVNEGVIVIGATNMKSRLDKALTRAGRFDVEIAIHPPNLKGREEILELYLDKKPLDKDITVLSIAKRTTGFTGADLSNLCNQSAIKATKAGRSYINRADVEYAYDKITMGLERSKVRLDEVNRNTAYHESGHALVRYFSNSRSKLHKMTILPRGNALGVTHYTPDEISEYSRTKSEIIMDIDMAMGGRIAEELMFGEDNVTTGASSDMVKATELAEHMVRMYGFSDKAGLRVYPKEQTDCSDKTRELIDSEIQKILSESYERTKKLLVSKKHHLEALSEALLEYETLDADQIDQIIKGKKLTTPKPKPRKAIPNGPTFKTPVPNVSQVAPSIDK